MPDEPVNDLQTEGSQQDASVEGTPQGGAAPKGQAEAGKSKPTVVPVEDLNRLRSTYDKQLAAQQRQYEALNQQYQQLAAAAEKNEREGLTDDELVAYEADKAQYEANQRIAMAEQRAAEAQYQAQFFQLKQYYLSKGVPVSLLDIEDPSDLQEAVLEYFRTELDRARKGQAQPKKGDAAPQVTTHKPASGTAPKLSWSSIPLGSKQETEVLSKLASGLLKPEDIAP